MENGCHGVCKNVIGKLIIELVCSSSTVLYIYVCVCVCYPIRIDNSIGIRKISINRNHGIRAISIDGAH